MQKNWGTKVLAGFVLLLVTLLLTQVVSAYFSPPKATLHLGDGKFSATIADTEATRIKGLSGTLHLPADHAMVFVFDGDARHGIWMKDMRYAIDIVWLNDAKQVVDFVMHVPADSYPKVFTPKDNARYVVELKSGTVEKKNIRVGQFAVFSGTDRDI